MEAVVMKRSEKIEIRVSMEEKQALAGIANQEGRPVSGLVRDVLGKYIALNAPTSKRKPAWKNLGAVLAAGFIAGLIIPIGVVSAQNKPVYLVQGAIDDWGFGFPVNLNMKKERSVRLGTGSDDLYVLVSVEDGTETELRVKLCYSIEESCKMMATASLGLNPQDPSVWQTQGKNGENVFVTITRQAS